MRKPRDKERWKEMVEDNTGADSEEQRQNSDMSAFQIPCSSFDSEKC